MVSSVFKGEFDALSPKERLLVINIGDGCHTPREMANGLGDRVSNVEKARYL